MIRVRIWEEPKATAVVTVPGDACPACEFAEQAVRSRPPNTTMKGAIVHVELLDPWSADDAKRHPWCASTEGPHFAAGTIRRVEVLSDSPPCFGCVTVAPDAVRAERARINAAHARRRLS